MEERYKLKNKTYEEVYGIEKALSIKKKISDKMKGGNSTSFKKGRIVPIEERDKMKLYNPKYWLGKKRSEETKKKISEANKGKLSNVKGKHWKVSEKGRINIGKAKIGHITSKETRIKLSKVHMGKKYPKELYPNLGWRKTRKNQILPKKDTTIEIKIQKFLEQLGIEYFTHKYINIEHSYQCDIFIPSMNLVIECDGNYWHSYPIGREIDNIRTKELIEKGFKVLRLWEIEIKNMDLNDLKDKIKKCL